ncbi:MAG: HK97 gp10 family phage protein [Ruminococcus sp.]|nr:HK97 gp10 family phage protein [Ruminococcus sp.]
MGKMGKFSAKDLKKLQKQLNQIQPSDIDVFIERCAKELAARLLTKVIKRTPVGQYPASMGKTGGTLRRGWTADSHEEAESGNESNAVKYADSLEIKKVGNMFVAEIVNPVEYASYVEYGHRTANHKGFVEGRFMLKISEQELQTIAPHVLEAKVKKFLGGCMK